MTTPASGGGAQAPQVDRSRGLAPDLDSERLQPLAGPEGLFETIRSHVPTVQGQGQVFERLIKAFLTEDPLFRERFSQVWLWSEWPGRRGEHDTGIDLVAEERDGGLCAVQCKFYGERQHLDRDDIDSFLVASSRRPFTARLFVSTTERWGLNAEKVLADQVVPVQRIGIAELEASPFDWSRFDPRHPEQLPRHEAKRVRPHQRAAIDDVKRGFETSDRGKLIMACGTGKTFTALRVAEELVPPTGVVLFCVPSISLLSQSLRAWSADSSRPLHCLAVCSDAQVTKDEEDIHVYDLALPATTDSATIAQHLALAIQAGALEDRPLRVVFSTYQSLDRVAEAQQWHGAPAFDLVIADEAHRTTGALAKDEGYGGFTLVHDGAKLRAHRRLYMTATPRLYTDRAKAEARESDVLLCSMDDLALYGPEFHYLGFGRSVEAGLLSDYRVVVLMVDEAYANEAVHGPLADSELDLALQDAARLVGCWRGLSKRSPDPDEFAYDPLPMRRAVTFATTIAASRRVRAALPEVVEAARLWGAAGVTCEARHVDGGMGALVRDQALAWLREDPPEGTCRVLSNARCLSEGVDVPALDAVIFINPRKSQIDVVQAVGRVMRRAEGKKYGYVIIPVAVPAGEDPERVLDDNERYRVVWQVLQALRAHDDRFDAEINKLDLQRSRSGRIQVVGVGGDTEWQADQLGPRQLELAWQGLEEKVYARVVKRCGTRVYWEQWAEDVARIAQAHITRIEMALKSGGSVASAFDRYLEGLHRTINPEVQRGEAVEMLAQHLITMPVFEALFGDSEFTRQNPVSEAMAEVIRALHEEEAIESERAELSDFYRSVRTRAEGIDNLEGRQRVVKELYEVFFKRAFPRTAERLGIVYTPVEIVDFMLRSVQEVLRERFTTDFGASGVHVIDPFLGTGTFLARLLAMLDASDLRPVYQDLLHANEIVLLAYYVGAINIEQTYHALRGEGGYEPFPGIVLTDTFQLGEGQDELIPEFLRPNSERARLQQSLPITVVVTNPPYSVGQGSENDNNKNLSYPHLDERIRSSYAALTAAKLKNSLYDSYIRAFRWASDRVGERGIVCFVSNGAWIDSASGDGFRKSLSREFAEIYCLNLRGNQRTSGETSRREGGKVFGQGSRTPIAITLLVKDPAYDAPARIHYHDIGDYLSREEKLAKLAQFGSSQAVPWVEIVPNAAGDWVNQRSDLFASFPPLGDKASEDPNAVFTIYSNGVKTNRDAWAYNFSRAKLLHNMAATTDAYNVQRSTFLTRLAQGPGRRATTEEVDRFVDTDAQRISWDGTLKSDLRRGKPAIFDPARSVPSMYRPFCKQWLYFDRQWNNSVYLIPSLFPTPEHGNRVIAIPGKGGRLPFSTLMVDIVPDLCLADVSHGSQCFPRYRYVSRTDAGSLFGSGDRYERQDAISQRTLEAYRSRFGDGVTADDVFHYVYGVLHSPEYRTRFAAELGKMIPRLPMLDAFWGFAEAGRRLADLHVGYETVRPWPLDGLPGAEASETDLRVEHMRFAGTARDPDRSAIVVNPWVTLSGIPEEAHQYDVNGRSALAWLLDRYQVRVDKDSGIRNDPNDWSDDPHYIVDLVARVVRVSVESAAVIDKLPALGLPEP
ncbi:MAG: DEAD/DEAH box helicase [Candidatus Dormibacteria bacterium]